MAKKWEDVTYLRPSDLCVTTKTHTAAAGDPIKQQAWEKVSLCGSVLWGSLEEIPRADGQSQESPISTTTKEKGEAKPGFSLKQGTAQGWHSGMLDTDPY